MNCKEIKKRNKKVLQEMIHKYNIEENLEDLISLYTTVYIHKDYKQKRVRLLGIKTCKDKKTEKPIKKTLQLYVLSKRMIFSLPEIDVRQISYDLSLFAHSFSQLKLIQKIEIAENSFEEIIFSNALSEKEIETMKNLSV